jgi:hypothetical protein
MKVVFKNGNNDNVKMLNICYRIPRAVALPLDSENQYSRND